MFLLHVLLTKAVKFIQISWFAYKIFDAKVQKLAKNVIFGPVSKLRGRGGSKNFRIFFLIPTNDALTMEYKWAKEELDI